MAHKLTVARIRLPPIDSNAHDLVASFPLKRTDSERRKNVLARQKSISDQQVGSVPPVVQPSYRRQFTGSYDGRKSLQQSSKKIIHTEKIPTQFPGKAFAVLPPIGGKEHDGRPSGKKQPSIQPTETTKINKSTDSKVCSESSKVNKPKRVAKKQISALGLLVNIDRKQEYEVRSNNSPDEPRTEAPKTKDLSLHSPTKTEALYRQTNDFQNIGHDEEDDDDSTMMKLSEVLQFLEWSSELREFLNGKNSLRRGATCSEIDPMLPHAVDVIRDILLKQTMEELCMMW